MYNLSDLFPDIEVATGTNLLIAGPPMTGKSRVALDIVATGYGQGEGSIIVTTKDSGQKTLSQYSELADVDVAPVGIVDCVSKQQGMRNAQQSPNVKYASSPVDMTGIGIELSEFLQEFYQDRNVRRNRILLDSLSTLLMYSNLQTVFRFLHVFTGRIQSADALGVFLIDSTAHDEQTMSTLKQLFDAEIRIRETEDHQREYRTTGLGTDVKGWQQL